MEPPKGTLCTKSTLVTAFTNSGLAAGDTVLLHSSLSKIGWVCGGAEAVILALLEVLGPEGTLVVPTHSSDNSDPAKWEQPPVPKEWWDTIRQNTPVFNPKTTRTRGMGAIAELARTFPGVLRSDHPQTSFAAIGPRAKCITDGHQLDSMLGENSPLARLEELNAKIVLLGVGFDVCTMMHLAEYRLETTPREQNSFAFEVDGQHVWKTVEDAVVDNEDFEAIGKEFVAATGLYPSKVGDASCYVVSAKELVVFTETWMKAHRRNTDLQTSN
ncbi:hypothetical protein VHEMI08524 [[Torrubiella] hemipterigena]|uniref:Aminoglycoside N(3)-acetyltransferase n=1 Tax=[Torrubiella] hemipterigena TaxID=1531966 RepID=A0A0A1TPU8_9HYPO|nr:hypothetical protein VHEMI08524 [[Torrubiella] hemipterigena]